MQILPIACSTSQWLFLGTDYCGLHVFTKKNNLSVGYFYVPPEMHGFQYEMAQFFVPLRAEFLFYDYSVYAILNICNCDKIVILPGALYF